VDAGDVLGSTVLEPERTQVERASGEMLLESISASARVATLSPEKFIPVTDDANEEAVTESSFFFWTAVRSGARYTQHRGETHFFFRIF
jgi:hypothetical protein